MSEELHSEDEAAQAGLMLARTVFLTKAGVQVQGGGDAAVSPPSYQMLTST